MSEKLYKSSDVIDILLGELSHKDYLKVIQRLALVPSAIVRCKDCKWFGDFGCAIRIVDDSDKPTENDFCSFAERRSE